MITKHIHAKNFELILGTGKSMIINVASQWAEVILLKVGDDPTKPRVMLMAFTGMAASLIGKSILIYQFALLHLCTNSLKS